MNFEKIIFKKIEVWVLLLVIIFFIFLTILFGSLVLRSETAKKVADIPEKLKKIFSGELDIGVQNRFGDKSGLIFHNKKFQYEENFHLLLARYDGDQKKSLVELINLKSGKIIHTWKPNINFINSKSKISKEFINLNRDHNQKRYQIIYPYLSVNGDLYFHSIYSPLVKIDICSKYVSSVDEMTHHSIEFDGSGIWTPFTTFGSNNNPGLDEKIGTNKKLFYDDGIMKVDLSNNIVFKKSLIEIFLDNGLSHLIFSGKEPSYDPFHLNDIQPALIDGEFYKRGDLFLSFRHLSTIVLYRPTTNKILWYKKFPWEFQHDVDVIDSNRISIFNNNRLLHNFDKTIKNNNLIIYDFSKDNTEYYHKDIFDKFDVRTVTMGSAEIFKNKSFLIEENNHGRLLMFDKNDKLIWEYINKATKNKKLYRVNGSRIISLDENKFEEKLRENNDCKI